MSSRRRGSPLSSLRRGRVLAGLLGGNGLSLVCIQVTLRGFTFCVLTNLSFQIHRGNFNAQVDLVLIGAQIVDILDLIQNVLGLVILVVISPLFNLGFATLGSRSLDD